MALIITTILPILHNRGGNHFSLGRDVGGARASKEEIGEGEAAYSNREKVAPLLIVGSFNN